MPPSSARPVLGIVQALQRRVRLDPFVGVAVGDLPHDVAGVHVVGRDASVRRLDERKSLRTHSPRTAACAGTERWRAPPRPPPRPPPPPPPAPRARRCLLRIGAGWCACRVRRGRRAASATTSATTTADEVHVRTVTAGLERHGRHVRHRRDVQHVRFGIPCRALPERRALRRGNLQRSAKAAFARDDRRRVQRTDLVLLQHRARFGVELGREIDQILLPRRPADRRVPASSDAAASARTIRREPCRLRPSDFRSATPACR